MPNLIDNIAPQIQRKSTQKVPTGFGGATIRAPIKAETHPESITKPAAFAKIFVFIFKLLNIIDLVDAFLAFPVGIFSVSSGLHHL